MSTPQSASEHQSAVAGRSDLHESPSFSRTTVVGHLGVHPDVGLEADRLVENRVDAGTGWRQAVLTTGARAARLVEVLVDALASVVDLLDHPDAIAPDVFRLESPNPLADALADRLEECRMRRKRGVSSGRRR